MTRKPLSREVQEGVLLLCRRRCCICYGFNRDTSIRAGQIAHLDKNPENDRLDNLAFLCLEHHDLYDGRTSQSKSLTMNEVRRFRKELHEAIDQLWKQPVHFGALEFDPDSNIAGHYIREGEFESAEMDISYLGNKRVRVNGFAVWGTAREFGPNVGELDFEDELRDGKIAFSDEFSEKVYRAEITFRESGLTVEENYVTGYFGLNVSFEGQYDKVN